MPEHRTRALVLRSFDHGESDRVVRLYTQELGRITAIAKGARRSRRRFPGALEQLSIVEVRLVVPSRAVLARLESAGVVRSYDGLADDPIRFALACQLSEILERCTAEGDANPALFEFAVGVLGVLREEPLDLLLSLLLVTKTLARLGYGPRLDQCAICSREIEIGRAAGFDPRQGGALCPRCRDGSAAPVDPRLLRALAAGVRRPLRERTELGVDATGVWTASRMLEEFFHFHVGLDLRSTRFLRQLVHFMRLDASPWRRDTAPDLPGSRIEGRRPALGGVFREFALETEGTSEATTRTVERSDPRVTPAEDPLPPRPDEWLVSCTRGSTHELDSAAEGEAEAQIRAGVDRRPFP